MTRYALINSGVVALAIEAEEEFALSLTDYDLVLPSDTASIGWLYENGEFIRPVREEEPAPQANTPLAFLRRFTLAERIAIQQSSDPIIMDAMLMFNVAQDVQLDDPDTVAFVNYLASIEMISQARANEILEVVN